MTLMKSALFAVIAAASLQAMADPVTQTISLEATVPTTDYYVQPKESTWINQTQTLAYSVATGKLTGLTKAFDVKNTAGSITAKLLSTAVLTSGTSSIPLTVKFNNIALSTTDTSVVLKANAATASSVNLEVIPAAAPTGGYTPGKYSGTVQLSFDSIAT